ncbi:MAG: C4-dicarboxylate TRAP transporter substrate-binding protein [Pseudolabrys sp.]|jgi:TRAP-type C4-dicarboxylate transport system substrate-binding protein|nr:C4-dicarboxylate TRAP transporter substrate-binding protein [Pseudolabrys sp.]
MKNLSRALLAVGLIVGFGSAGASAQDIIKLTVVSGHPPATHGVRLIRDYFIPEVDKRLAAAGGKYKIEWTQAYAGSIAKPADVLETIEKGIGDVGYVPALFEADKLPLEQITYVTPFGSDELVKLMDVVRQLRNDVPEMNDAFKKHNQLHLASVGVDTYHTLTTFPVKTVEDFKGRKIGTAGLAARWLEGTGWVPVKGALPEYYNSIQTGIIEGTIVFESSIKPYKFYEVAKNITKIGFGAQQASDLTVNLRRWNAFPKEMQAIFLDVAKEYERQAAVAYQADGESSMKFAAEHGATISTLPDAERKKLAKMLPNIAQEWAKNLDKKGQPGTKVLKTYMDLCRKAGLQHARQWDQE